MNVLKMGWIVVLLAKTINAAIDTLLVQDAIDPNYAYAMIVVSKFAIENHDIREIKKNIIDSQIAMGIDTDVPRNEIKEIYYYLDGEAIEINKALYKDCYNVPDNKIGYMFERTSASGALLVISGGDAAGGYGYVLIANKEEQVRIVDKEDLMITIVKSRCGDVEKIIIE